MEELHTNLGEIPSAPSVAPGSEWKVGSDGRRLGALGRVLQGVTGRALKKKGQLVQVGLQPDSARPAPESEQKEKLAREKKSSPDLGCTTNDLRRTRSKSGVEGWVVGVDLLEITPVASGG